MTTEPVTNSEAPAVIRFPCGQCGAALEFTPGTDQLTCEYCGFENEIEAAEATIEELDYAAQLGELEASEETREVELVRCEACGAETERAAHLHSLPCAFCGADMIAAAAPGRLLEPRSLLPFHVTEDQAGGIFRAWIGGLWFAPSDLKRYARLGGRVQGVYLPYWTYDARAVTDYTGMRGEYYWVTQTYTTKVNGKTVTRTRQVRKTRWYPAGGTVRDRFDDLLVCASRSLPREYVHRLEPWDLGHLEAYRDEYLAGFRAERYQVDLPDGFAVACERMKPVIEASIRRDIGGDTQRITSANSSHHDITFKHLLLPVWLSAYRYKERVYRTMINARTGELQGERPWSAWKIALTVGAAVGVVLVGVAVAAFMS